MAASIGKRFPVVILGSTGSGKSKLALEIAAKFCGEIISTDSMQIYKGLDIVTNKVTSDEQKACPHHMLDYVDPLTANFTVIQYRDKALPIIDQLLSEHKTPIIVGGTNYYIEALLWNTLLGGDKVCRAQQLGTSDSVQPSSGEKGTKNDQQPASPPDGTTLQQQCENRPEGGSTSERLHGPAQGGSSDEREDSNLPQEEEEVPTKELHERLFEVDPDSAKRIHPNDRRKILRALQVYSDEGVPMTSLLKAQHAQEGAGQLRGPLRYTRPCILWIQCDQKVLDERTDRRVDQMVDGGLLEEMHNFHQQYNQHRLDQNKEADYEIGIFQSIGFKEFHPYLILSDEDKKSEKGQKLLNQGLEDMKRVTRRYARKQSRWVTNRFLRNFGDNVPRVYAVDSTDPAKYDENVLKPAIDIVEAFTKGICPSQSPLPCEENPSVKEHHVCDVCGGLVFVTALDWQAHIKGRRHKKSLQHLHNVEKRKHWKQIVPNAAKIQKTQE